MIKASFLQFSTDYKIDEDGNPADVYRTNVTEFHNRSYYLNGLVKQSYIYKGDDITQLFSKTVNTYEVKAINMNGLMDTTSNLPLTFDTGGSEGRKSAVPLLASTENFIYELGTSPLISKVNLLYDERARIIKYDYLGNPTTNDDDYTSEITYYTSTALAQKNIYTVPESIMVKDNAGQVKRMRMTASINEDTGDIGIMRASIDGSEWAETKLMYDIYGNLQQITMPENEAGASMFYKYTYDADNHKLVVKTEDAYTYSSLATYDYRFDKILQTTDISGNKVQHTYDNFSRLIRVRGPKEIAASKPYTISFSYYPQYQNLAAQYNCVDEDDFTPVAITSHYDELHPTNDIQTYTFVDGLGRPVQVKKDIELNTGSAQSPVYAEAVSVSGKVTYDEFGRSVNQYHPWHEEKVCGENLIINEHNSPYYSSVKYDEVDRPVVSIDPEGNEGFTEYSIDTDYFNNPAMKTKSIIDQDGSNTIITESFKDVNGRVTSTKNVLTTGSPQDIWTRFTYNSIGELLKYTDNEDISTTYVYDMMGRKIQLSHPDNGITKYFYDDSGKMTKVQTANLAANTNLQPEDRFIKYEYDINRPTKIIFPPTSGGNNLANVYYEYGTAGNEKGRLVHQVDATGEQYFEYGNMGELTSNIRTVVGPNIPTRTFETYFKYDSWNRILEIRYPDGEKVSYDYNLGGSLSKITGEIDGDPYDYVKRVDYDHFEQRTYQLYGNSTETFYEYTPTLRRLNNLNVKTSAQEDLFNNTYTYDKVGNVKSLINAALPNTVNLMGGQYEHTYNYDNLNRLTKAEGRFNGDSSQQSNGNDYTADYSLNMLYNTTHGIQAKIQKHSKNGNQVDLNSYENEYSYINGTHMLEKVIDANTQFTEEFLYDSNGNITKRTDSDQNTRSFHWDEANRLRVVEDQNAMQHYIYDAGGQRVLKASSSIETLYENGSLVNSNVSFDPYTTYPSSLIVVNSDGQYSKHYYSGSQRIVSRIGEEPAGIFDVQEQFRMSSPHEGSTGVEFSEEKIRNLQIADLTMILEKAKKGIPVFKKYKPESGKDTGETEESIDNEPINNEAQAEMTTMSAPGQFPYHNIYFYHPDHLGTSTYLTDANGEPYQFFLNLPFGETMAEQHSLTEDYETPFKFNGKELDAETGLYYYGARYYDPKTSIWLSTDPLMEKYPNFNPYAYCYQNPINVIDPTGMEGVDPKPSSLIDALIQQIRPDFSKVKNVSNVLNGKSWIDYQDLHSCGKASRSQCLKGGANPYYEGNQINMYIDTKRQNEHVKDYGTKFNTSKVDLQKGVDIIVENLLNDKPVMAGVMYTHEYGASGSNSDAGNNQNVATNHYITIVGMGVDEKGSVYFSYYDNYADPSYSKSGREAIGTDINENRLYYSPDGYFYDKTKIPVNDANHYVNINHYILTEVRPNQ